MFPSGIIQELGLKKAAATRIGDARHRGVSGGERKRTNIAVEMMQDPSLLFLDEPTSGLDAFQALNVMETLKLLTLSGVTVLVSVHQPRSFTLSFSLSLFLHLVSMRHDACFVQVFYVNRYMECEPPSAAAVESNGHYGSSSNGAVHMVMDQDLKVKSTAVRVHQKTPLLKS